MRTLFIKFVVVVLIASVVFGKPQGQPSLDRVLHFTHIGTTQGFQEIATTMRTLVDIRELSLDIAQRSLAVRGTADRVALAEWLFNQLDSSDRKSAADEYRMPGFREDVVRVFYLPPAETVQCLQEIVTLLRTVADVRRIFGCTAQRAVPLRGTADQLRWLNGCLASWRRLARGTQRPKSTDCQAAAMMSCECSI